MIMTKNYPCLCQAIRQVLCSSRWIGILPIVPNTYKPNHLVTGCSFYISKFWLTISIITQVALSIYSVTTTSLRWFYGPDDEESRFEWYVMTLGYMTMQADVIVCLFGGIFYSRRIAKILVRISRLDGRVGEMRQIFCKLNKILAFMLVLFCVKLSSLSYIAWYRMETHKISARTILDSSLGVLIRGINAVYPQMQCAMVMMLCLLISSKFKHQAETIKLTLNHVTFHATKEQTSSIPVRTATVKWMGAEVDNLNTVHLEHISDQYQETHQCLAEVNHCVGIQLLVTLTANLFVTVYYLYRYVAASSGNVMIVTQQKIHCMLSVSCLLITLLLYMCVGQILKTESRKPIQALQQAKLLRFPTLLREQIQCLILQWSSSDPGGLSAFNVINVGPWLLAPIAGNVITYLLVAIQFKTNTSYTESVNLSAVLDSVF